MRSLNNFGTAVLLGAVTVLSAAALAQYRELPRFDPPPIWRPLTPTIVPPLVVLAPPPPPPPEVRPLEIRPVRICHDESFTWTDSNGVRHVEFVRRCD